MSIFTKLKNSSSTGIWNALFGANRADLDNPFSTKNDLVPYTSFCFRISQSSTHAPVLTLLGASGPLARINCREGTCACTRTDGSQWCSSGCCVEATYVSAGIFKITIPKAPTFGFDVVMGPPKTPTTQLGVEKLDTTSFKIRTSLAGVATNELLVNNYLEIKLFN